MNAVRSRYRPVVLGDLNQRRGDGVKDGVTRSLGVFGGNDN